MDRISLSNHRPRSRLTRDFRVGFRLPVSISQIGTYVLAYRIFRVLNWETALSARGPTSTRPPRGSADDGRLDPGSRPGLILGCWAMLGASRSEEHTSELQSP